MTKDWDGTEKGRSEAGPVELSIFDKIEADFKEDLKFIEVINQSGQHAGHAAMQGKDTRESHFFVGVVSNEFQDVRPIERQRRINKLLKSEFDQGLHALSMKTKTL